MVYGWWWYWGSQWSQAYYVLILGALLCPHAASKDVVPVPVIISLHNLLSTILIECRSQKQQWPDKSRLGQDETSFFLLLGSWLMVEEGGLAPSTPYSMLGQQCKIPLVGVDILLLVAWVMHDSWLPPSTQSPWSLVWLENISFLHLLKNLISNLLHQSFGDNINLGWWIPRDLSSSSYQFQALKIIWHNRLQV